jgi:hypothetical protein
VVTTQSHPNPYAAFRTLFTREICGTRPSSAFVNELSLA